MHIGLPACAGPYNFLRLQPVSQRAVRTSVEKQLDLIASRGESVPVFLRKPWADPEGGQGVRVPPEKSQKYRFFFSNTGSEPLKNQASIQCCAIIGQPAKRHLNGVSLAGR